MIRKLLATASALIVGCSLIAMAAPARANTVLRPKLALAVVHPRITAGQAPQFSYSATKVPRGTHIVLQRQYGTGRVWKVVQTETARTGHATAPKLSQLGNYVYRLAAIRNKTYLATSSNRHVYAYGNVPLLTLCNASQQMDAGCNGAQTVQVGSRIFTWTVWLGTSEWPEADQDLSMLATSCRTLSIQWTGQSQNAGVTTYVQVVQQASDEQHAEVVNGSVGSATFRLDGGPFYLNAAFTRNSDGDWDGVVATGSANCYTFDGTR
jgi:hypothetical protein